MGVKKVDMKDVLGLLVAAGAFFLMLTMGVAQLEQRQTVKAMSARVARELKTNPSTVALAKLAESAANDLRRGFMTGVWSQGKSVKVGPVVMNGTKGYWIVSPLVLNDGTAVLVNRGWVSDAMTKMMLDTDPPSGIVTLIGSLRVSDAKGMMVDDSPSSWSGLNVDAIANNNHIANFAPLALFMETSAPADDDALTPVYALSGMHSPALNMAVFWFGMAALVVGLYFMAVLQPLLAERLAARRLNPPKRR